MEIGQMPNLNTTIVKVKLKYHTSGTGPKWEFKYNYC